MKLQEVATSKPVISPEAAEWLWTQRHAHRIGHRSVQQDGTVDVTGSVAIYKSDGIKIPVQFGKVGGQFSCSGSNLTTLQGCPHTVSETFFCSNVAIKSFDGAPLRIGGNFVCYKVSVDSLSGIGKSYARMIGGIFKSNRAFTHMLGLILVEGLQRVDTLYSPVDTILNKYVGTGDILSCQDELIDAGFVEQVRL